MSENTKNIIERAIKTFCEAFISTLVVGLGTFNYSDMSDKKKVLTILLLPSLATAISAAWNYIQSKTSKSEEELYDDTDF